MNQKVFNNKVIIIVAIMILIFSFSDYFIVSKYTESKMLMDTLVEITVYGKNKKKLAKIVKQGFDEMERVENLMSSFKSGSEVSRINNSNGAAVAVGLETAGIIEESKRINQLTNGAFDITVGALVTLWNVTAQSPKVPSESSIKELLQHIGNEKVATYKIQLISEDGKIGDFAQLPDPQTKIDLGGIAKGYAIKRAAEVLKTNGIKSGFIDAGGDIVVIGSKRGKDFRIGIKSPDDPNNENNIIGVVHLQDTSVVTSGDYERFFVQDGVRYHHILDPKTGYPARGSRSVTVITKDPVLADGLSTAIFVLGPEKGIELANSLDGVDVLIVDDKNNITYSKNALKFIELEAKN